MDIELFTKAQEIKDKLSKVERVINAAEKDEFDSYCVALMVKVWGHDIPLYLPKEITNDMLEVCYKYKSIYEKQLEEL